MPPTWARCESMLMLQWTSLASCQCLASHSSIDTACALLQVPKWLCLIVSCVNRRSAAQVLAAPVHSRVDILEEMQCQSSSGRCGHCLGLASDAPACTGKQKQHFHSCNKFKPRIRDTDAWILVTAIIWVVLLQPRQIRKDPPGDASAAVEFQLKRCCEWQNQGHGTHRRIRPRCAISRGLACLFNVKVCS